MVSQVFQVFSMTSPEKDSAKMLQIFLLAPQMFDLHWQNFWVKKKKAHISYLFLVKQSSTCTYVFFKSQDYFPCSSLHQEIFIEFGYRVN